MQVTATLDEKLKMVYDALTTGMPYFVDYGFRLDYKNADYNKARKELQAQPRPKDELPICIEDIQIQMVRMGLPLTFTDIEGEGDHTATLTTALIESNWSKVPMHTVASMSKDWDADDADVLMQYLLWGEVVFG